MIRVALAALAAILMLAIMAWPQRQSALSDLELRIRDMERWQAAHDRAVPKSPEVYISQIQANTARIARLEGNREADIRWFFAGIGTLGIASLAFLLKRTLFRNGGHP